MPPHGCRRTHSPPPALHVELLLRGHLRSWGLPSRLLAAVWVARHWCSWRSAMLSTQQDGHMSENRRATWGPLVLRDHARRPEHHRRGSLRTRGEEQSRTGNDG